MAYPPNPACQTIPALVGVVCNRFFVGGHDQHGAKERYRRALSNVAGVTPVFIPATGTITDVSSYLHVLSGLLFPGGTSIVNPALHQDELATGFPLGPARDHVIVQLMRGAVSRGMPILAIDRGFHEMNVAFGGTLHSALCAAGYNKHHWEGLSEALDTRYRYKHRVHLSSDGILSGWLGTDVALVNSLHIQGVRALGEALVAEAIAPDGLIEAMRVVEARFAIGVQWHPEVSACTDRLSQSLFVGFGAACRRYRRSKGTRESASA
ncbi:gamma-glutamyl-gamma-aminobutyrate hydrolase family protein [Cupriavidus pauculus]|uniref:Gamma-glutamyl-gamma-aminobutyrate hydrolase family protein n=1 Tax=Cupriavidus pauculus TaxID=82633 RepID=A0A3G8HAI1_9BURK|nr:gamma-glutamyl-gamma-aminobutyrate hydrolase family protein [Cupriavidus pauculus]AZG17275.1 gamma-glutamyl-gamma-aminobutyrate hydrolase family protein [Cupriavidus pauculus]